MQTFLPYPSFVDSAKCLDNKRLSKQRVEAKQIFLALTIPEYGRKNHPAVKMWKGHEGYLLVYTQEMCKEWRKRGFEDSVMAWTSTVAKEQPVESFLKPAWIGNENFHASHRSNLLRKDPEWYGNFGWTEPDDLPYVWPTK